MAFKYHPPTRTGCTTCERIVDKHKKPIVTTMHGRASSGDNFPIHNWYNFVLGYSPRFPDYIIEREKATSNSVIADPFMGSGTTNICAKSHGMKSMGLDANDYFHFAAQTKLNWDIDIKGAKDVANDILTKFEAALSKYSWPVTDKKDQLTLIKSKGKDYKQAAEKLRTVSLPERYISDAPLLKLMLLKKIIADNKYPDDSVKNLIVMAFTTITLPASNVYYGPGFGVRKPKIDVDVYKIFKNKIERMIDDLDKQSPDKVGIEARTCLGDARLMSDCFGKETVDLMITSPPYPGDHEYTKHSKIELIFMDFATDIQEFRVIKKRMLRGSTTNIYKEDNDGDLVRDIKSIKIVTDEIARRLEEDNATSGFEKLYTKLVWEYFGGMYRVFKEAKETLKPGGKFVLLVSDSHAFKMVHIETAEILAEVAVKAGLVNPRVELWQHKGSTSHKYNLFEEVLTVEKSK